MADNPYMVANSHSIWGVRLTTLIVWALAAASVAYWGLRLSAPAPGRAVPVAAPMVLTPDAQALASLLGAMPAQAAVPVADAASSRFALVGVLAGRESGGGAALIAVDGKPARPFRVGAVVDAGLVLQSLGPRQAHLGASAEGPATLTLEMPLRK